MVIKLELCSLRNQVIRKTYDAFVELHEDRMHYKVKFKADEPKDREDESLGWEEVNTCWERIVFKERISGVEIEYIQATANNDNKENRWCVVICMTGFKDDIKVFFEKEPPAREFLKQISDWLFKNEKS